MAVVKSASKTKHLPERFGLKPGADIFPLMVLPSVSNVCNSRCRHCWYTANPSLRKRDGIPFMPARLFRKIIDEVAEHKQPRPLIRITGTGEPFCMPDLAELIVYGCTKKHVRIAVISNGSLITPEMSARLIDAGIEALEVSVDAADATTYARIRPGLSFDVLLRNVEAMLKFRAAGSAKTKIIISFVENPQDIDPDAVERFWRGRVDNVIRRKYLTYGQLSGKLCSKKTYLPANRRVPCPYPFERMVILASGNVTFCNFDVQDGYYMGNVNDQTIREIWRGDKFEVWRKLVLDLKFEEVPLCAKCEDWKYKSWNYNFFRVLKNAGVRNRHKET